MNIIIFGDSIVSGAWDEEGGWAYRIKKYFTKEVIESNFEKYHEVHVLGISGDTTADLLQRFQTEVDARVNHDPMDNMVVFAIGINDSLYDSTKGNCYVEVSTFAKNVHTLLTSVSKVAKHVYWVGLTPVDEMKVNPVPWTPQFSYTNELIESYDRMLCEICQSRSVSFLDIHSIFMHTNYKKLLSDGVHPNTSGHEVIYKSVREKLIASSNSSSA